MIKKSNPHLPLRLLIRENPSARFLFVLALLELAAILVLTAALYLHTYGRHVSSTEGYCAVMCKYENDMDRDGSNYYIVLGEQGKGVTLEVDEETYAGVVCHEKLRYHFLFREYQPTGRLELLLFDLNDVIDNRP